MPSPIIPIVNQSRPYTVWYISDVYTGPSGTGRYVPNVNDKVEEWGRPDRRVIAVDYGTNLCTLQEISANTGGGDTPEDVLLGSGPGTVREEYRVYLNTSVVPHVMAFDSRMHLYGSDN